MPSLSRFNKRVACHHRFSSAARDKVKQEIPLRWLDLRGSGFSVLERLLLEECLLQTDTQHNWMIAGYHDATQHRYLRPPPPPATQEESSNGSAVIVMGIGGKADQLLDSRKVRDDGVMTLKRFSGGGTVVLDHDSIWTTLIGRPKLGFGGVVEAFPRPLMKYTADTVFGPLFERLHMKQQQQQNIPLGRKQTLVLDTKSCAVENTGRVITIPIEAANELKINEKLTFSLRENDYVLGERKMGGNAQSIGKNGWLHHTSFLWDFQDEHMNYLLLPQKRPEYRRDRSHDEFLVKLSGVYPSLKKSDFCKELGRVCEAHFAVERVTPRHAMAIVEENFGSLQLWWETKSRTKLVHKV